MRLALLFSAAAVLVVSTSCSDDPPPLTSDAGGSGSPTSFRKAVVPVFYESCALTACHGSRESNLGIYLPYAPEGIYAELKKTSTQAPLPFVKPGDPDGSYLMLKMDGTQGKLGTQCLVKDCGAAMPPGDVIPQAKRDIVRRWIAEGAKDD